MNVGRHVLCTPYRYLLSCLPLLTHIYSTSHSGPVLSIHPIPSHRRQGTPTTCPPPLLEPRSDTCSRHRAHIYIWAISALTFTPIPTSHLSIHKTNSRYSTHLATPHTPSPTSNPSPAPTNTPTRCAYCCVTSLPAPFVPPTYALSSH